MFILSLIVFGSMFGQDVEYRKPVVLINFFKCKGSINSTELDLLRNSIVAKASKIKRINVVDIASETSLSSEMKRRMRDEMIADELVRNQEMTQLGANYILECTASEVSIKRNEYKDKKGNVTVNYKAELTYDIRLVSTEDGTTVYSRTKKSTSYDENSNVARSEVFQGNLDCEFINEVAPLQGQIVDTDFKVKDDKMISCYIKLGEIHGVESGDDFEVKSVKYVAGEPLYDKIGSLKVEKVYNKISECKIRRGSAKELLKAMKSYLKLKTESPDEASPLIVVSDCRSLLGIF